MTFKALVTYVQPSFEELTTRFGGVRCWVDCKGGRFEPIEACKKISQESRELSFEYLYPEDGVSTGVALVMMEYKGLRPALYEESLGFDEKYPEEKYKYPIRVIGSEMRLKDGLYQAQLWSPDGEPSFSVVPKYSDTARQSPIIRYLAVRE